MPDEPDAVAFTAVQAFVCPLCASVSYNRQDIQNRYCGNCHTFVDDPSIQTKWRRYITGQTVVEYDVYVAIFPARRVVRSQFLRNGDLFCVLPPLPSKPKPERSAESEGTDQDGHE